MAQGFRWAVQAGQASNGACYNGPYAPNPYQSPEGSDRMNLAESISQIRHVINDVHGQIPSSCWMHAERLAETRDTAIVTELLDGKPQKRGVANSGVCE